MNLQDKSILILGPRKGGTTLLQRLLDGAVIYVYPAELKIKLLLADTWVSKRNLIEKYRTLNRLRHEDLPGFNSKKYNELLEKSASCADSLRDLIICDLVAAIASSPCLMTDYCGWAVKEAGGDIDRIFSDWKMMFPDAKVLMIVRNPPFVTRAVFRSRRKKHKKLSVRTLLKQAIDPWRVFIKQSRYAKRDDTLIISYDCLVADTAKVMRKVCKFLSVEYGDTFCRPTLFGKDTIVKTSSRRLPYVYMDKSRLWKDMTMAEMTVTLCAWLFYGYVIRIFLGAPSYGSFRRSLATDTKLV